MVVQSEDNIANRLKSTDSLTISIIKSLELINITHDSKRGWVMQNKMKPIKPDVIAVKIRSSMRSNNVQSIPSVKEITDILKGLSFDFKDVYEDECYEKIKYNPDIKHDYCTEISRMISGNNYNEIYPWVLKQFIYVVKRKYKYQYSRMPIFPIFYGAQGTGKSNFIRLFCNVLPPHKYEFVINGENILDDKFSDFISDSLIIHLDEMGGMNKISLSKLKSMVDSQDSTNRIYYTKDKTKDFTQASFIGATNHYVSNIFVSTDDIRKYFQWNFYSVPEGENEEQYKIKKNKEFESFDFFKLWQSVDENGPEPFSNPEIYQKYLTLVNETCKSSTPTTLFLDDYINEHSGEWILKRDLHKEYETAMRGESKNNILSYGKFKELCEQRGFVFKHTEKGDGYIIPQSKMDKLKGKVMSNECS